jgi:hypothetical protein
MAVISAEQTPRSSVSWSLRIPASCPDLLEGGRPHPVNDEGEVDPRFLSLYPLVNIEKAIENGHL